MGNVGISTYVDRCHRGERRRDRHRLKAEDCAEAVLSSFLS